MLGLLAYLSKKAHPATAPSGLALATVVEVAEEQPVFVTRYLLNQAQKTWAVIPCSCARSRSMARHLFEQPRIMKLNALENACWIAVQVLFQRHIARQASGRQFYSRRQRAEAPRI